MTKQKRFVIIEEKVACELCGVEFLECRKFDFRYALVDTTEKRILGMDGGEPEDQTLGRDWNWVADELNKVAEEKQNGRK